MTSILLGVMLIALIGLAWFPCCCPTIVCEIYSDDFSTDNLSTDYTQHAGSWSVGSGVLATSDSDALLSVDTAHPDAEAEHYLSIDIKGSVIGDELRVVVAFTDDANYLYAQVTVDQEPTCGSLKLFKVVSGVHTQLGSSIGIAAANGSTHTLELCYLNLDPSPSYLTAKFTSSDGTETIYKQAVVATGTQVGLGTGTLSGTATFDNLDYQKHDDSASSSSEATSCPMCDVPECRIAHDDFTRANADEPGCLWTEVLGDFDIVSNSMQTSDTGAILKCELPHHNGLSSAYTGHIFEVPPAGEKLRFFFDYVNSTTYHCVEFESHATAPKLRLFKNGSQVGSDTTSTLSIVGDTIQIEVCYDGASTVQATLRNYPGGGIIGNSLVGNSTPNGGTFVAIGTGSSITTAIFYAFGFHRHGSEADGEMCPLCTVPLECDVCEDGEMASIYRVAISGAVDNGFCGSEPCTLVNGTFVQDSGCNALCAACGGQSVCCRGTFVASSVCIWGQTCAFVKFSFSGGLYRIRVTVKGCGGGGTIIYEFEKTSSTQFDCDQLLNEDIPLVSAPRFQCTGTPTCAITAL